MGREGFLQLHLPVPVYEEEEEEEKKKKTGKLTYHGETINPIGDCKACDWEDEKALRLYSTNSVSYTVQC